MSDKPGGTPSTEGEAVFGFEDLQGLREEYEERIRVMKAEHEAQLQKDGASRQELITDLTFELAAAREEGEMRARAAEAKRTSLEAELRTALAAIDRIDAEVQRVKLALADALSPTDTNIASTPAAPTAHGPTPAPVSTVGAPAPAPASTTTSAMWQSGPVPVATPPEMPAEIAVANADVVATAPATPPPVPVDPTPASTAAGARRKKIRLR